MATQLVEFRPGKWVKVVDGHIVGRATPEEVAAWQQAGGARSQAALDLELEVDLSAKPATGPEHALDISRRPAFERRGRATQPARPASPGGEEPGRASPVGAKGAAPAKGKERGAPEPTGKGPPAAKGAERRQAEAPAGRESPLRHPAGSAAGEPAALRQAPASPLAESPARAPAAAAGAAEPSTPKAAEPEAPPTGAAAQGPRYWWVWNARGQPVKDFLAEWAARYRQKFGHKPTLILCHADDLAAVEACGYNAEVGPLLQPGHFYLSHTEGG